MRSRSRTIAVSAALLFFTTPSTVYAAYLSFLGGSTATMVGDVGSDTLTITQVGGLFRHNRFTAGDPGFNSDFDFDTITAGDQTLSSATAIINIAAGDGNDTITIGDGIDLRGVIDGQVGTDTLDYSGFTTAVRANLGLGTTGLSATLGADQENPPTTHTATATATVGNYSVTARTFDITVTVTGLLPADVTGFHIHQGAVGVNGPIIVDFTGVAPLVPAGTGFTFTATGQVLPAASEAALLGGGTYVNIHTAAFPGGAIRGQLFSAGNVNLATGVATGTNFIQNIENVTGGVGNDSLVGSSAINTINGGAGADWIVGGPGNDVLNGDAGADALVWSNGDGTDVDEGGADSDTVQVNGSVAAADIFVVSPNAARLRFDRTNLGLFSLDIGTVETLTVNGIGGDDSFNVNDLAGIAALTTLNLNGLAGIDVFNLSPTSAGAISINLHGGTGTDTLQGPNGTNIWNVTAPNEGNIIGLVSSFRFIDTLSGGPAADTFNAKAFTTGTPTVNAGAGADTLNYDAESRAVSGDLTPPDGVINSPPVQPLTFTQIETVTTVNPQPSITINDVTVAEGGPPTSALFYVSLSNASSLTVTVNAATANGSATAPDDYTHTTGMVTFAPGDILKPLSVPIAVDALAESTETFVVDLSAAVNATIADPQGLGTITDNATPTISAIVGQASNEDTATGAIAFTVGDLETAAASLTVTGSSSNTTLVPDGYVAIGGSGTNRTVTLTPAPNEFGTTTITLTVNDGSGHSASTAFVLTVTAVNDAPTITAIANQTIDEDTATSALPFTIGDFETAAADLIVSSSSSNTALVPLANIVVGGSGANRTVTVTPAANQNGTATITLTVSDGVLSAQTTFTLTVTAVSGAPTITGPGSASVEENTTGTITFIVADDGPLASLSVTATAGDAALFPAGALVVSGTGATRTAALTPAEDRDGATSIMLTVSDGAQTATLTIPVTVTPAAAPLAPSALVAASADNVVTLTWQAPASGPVPTYYVIDAGTAPDTTTVLVVDTHARDTTWTTTLPAGLYFFRVRSGNSGGTSPASNEAAAGVSTTRQVPGTPLGLTAQIAGARVTLAWQAPVMGGPADRWQIVATELATGLLHAFQFPEDVLRVSGDVPAGAYRARVQGGNASGLGPVSNEVALVVGTPAACAGVAPDPPVLLPAVVVGSSVTLSWRAPKNVAVASYQLFARIAPGGPDLATIDVGPVTALAADGPAGLYYVTAVATNACGTSARSSAIAVRIDGATALAAPANLRAAIDGARVALAWDAVPGAAWYLIEVGSTPGASDLAIAPWGGTHVAVDHVPAGRYFVRSRAVGTAGTSAPSFEIEVNVPSGRR